jgi:integrase
MAHRRVNGEGTIYRRKDGRYEAATYVPTASGRRKRVRIYARTRAEVSEKLVASQRQAHQGIPVSDVAHRLDEYLDYWLEHVVRSSRRPSTYENYAWVATRFLKPGLGTHRLEKLSVATVQKWLDKQFGEGMSAHRIRLLRAVLSAALTRAQREELVQRNVARLVELPKYQAKERNPWSAEEAKRFLAAAIDHELYPAFLMLMLYGLRRGEVLGLRWSDVDFDHGLLHIRNQLQRRGGGFLQGSVKTRAGERDLPLLVPVREVLRSQQEMCAAISPGSPPDGLVFITTLGQPRDPDSFRVSFQRLAKRNGLRVIAVHDVRHTTATLLKDLGVPARDAQIILGHADISTTQQIYQHASLENRQNALEKVTTALLQPTVRVKSEEVVEPAVRCRQNADYCRQNDGSVALLGMFLTSVNNGTPDRIRTYDLWYRKSKIWSLRECVTGVEGALNVWRRQWILGCVAVSVAVRHLEQPLGELAIVGLLDSGSSTVPIELLRH